MSTKDFRTKNEIIVNIGAGETDDDGAGRSGGLVRPSRKQRDFLPRRLSGVYVNFYDPAQITDGAGGFMPTVFRRSPSFVPTVFRHPTEASFEQIQIAIDRFSAADWAAYYATFRAVAFDDWKTTFRKIDLNELRSPYNFQIRNNLGGLATIQAGQTYPESYGIELTPQGLKINDLDKLETNHTNAYFSFSTDPESADFKVTETDDPDADAAEFNLDKSCDVFFMPKPALEIGSNNTVALYESVPPDMTYPSGHIHQILHDHFINIQYTLLPRQNFPRFVNPAASNTPASDPTGIYSNWINYLKGLAAPRGWRIIRDFIFPGGSFAHSTTVENGAFAPGGIPTNVSYRASYFGFRYNNGSTQRQYKPTNYEADFNGYFFDNFGGAALVAVIMQGAKTFFVWNIADDLAADVQSTTGNSGGSFEIRLNDGY